MLRFSIYCENQVSFYYINPVPGQTANNQPFPSSCKAGTNIRLGFLYKTLRNLGFLTTQTPIKYITLFSFKNPKSLTEGFFEASEIFLSPQLPQKNFQYENKRKSCRCFIQTSVKRQKVVRNKCFCKRLSSVKLLQKAFRNTYNILWHIGTISTQPQICDFHYDILNLCTVSQGILSSLCLVNF